MTLLSVEGLEARHGQLKAVRGVNLTIEKSETVALVGANGAGKTTLLRTIAGAHRIAAGRIAFKGEDIGRHSAHARAALGYLQDLSAAVEKAADEHKCLVQAMREIKLPKYEKWANYDAYLPMNIERYCDFYSLGI